MSHLGLIKARSACFKAFFARPYVQVQLRPISHAWPSKLGLFSLTPSPPTQQIAQQPLFLHGLFSMHSCLLSRPENKTSDLQAIPRTSCLLSHLDCMHAHRCLSASSSYAPMLRQLPLQHDNDSSTTSLHQRTMHRFLQSPTQPNHNAMSSPRLGIIYILLQVFVLHTVELIILLKGSVVAILLRITLQSDRLFLIGTAEGGIKAWNVDAKRVVCDLNTTEAFPRYLIRIPYLAVY